MAEVRTYKLTVGSVPQHNKTYLHFFCTHLITYKYWFQAIEPMNFPEDHHTATTVLLVHIFELKPHLNLKPFVFSFTWKAQSCISTLCTRQKEKMSILTRWPSTSVWVVASLDHSTSQAWTGITRPAPSPRCGPAVSWICKTCWHFASVNKCTDKIPATKTS